MTPTKEQRAEIAAQFTDFLRDSIGEIVDALAAAETELDRRQKEFNELVDTAAALKATEASWKRDCIAAWAERDRLRQILLDIQIKAAASPTRTLGEASDALYWCHCHSSIALRDAP